MTSTDDTSGTSTTRGTAAPGAGAASSGEGVAKVADLIKDIKTCMLTTLDASGTLVSRPMVVQEARFDGELWFVSDGGASKVVQIEHGARVNAAFATRDAWVSVAGRAQVLHDQSKAEQLWGPGLDAWFPEGPSTPGLALVRVQAETAEYWDTPGGTVSTLIGLATSKVKGERPDVGENGTVTFPGA